MISEELKNIIEHLNNQGEMSYKDAATEKEIADFEKSNSITFPVQFREWLQFSDGGEFFLPAGIQLYGVSHKPLIDPSENDRPDDNYIVIGVTSWGDPIVFKMDSEDISIYNHEDGRIEDDETYADFHAFLGDLDNMLNSEEE